MRSLLVIYDPAVQAVPNRATASATESLRPETRLRSCGYSLTIAANEHEAKSHIRGCDAAVLHLPVSKIHAWGTLLTGWKLIPLLWWCCDSTATLSVDACEDHVLIDGILTPSMQEQELHWALHFGAKQCFEREQWHNERKQLLSRIEERKWIDMAKGILCEIKQISESEAYDLLRKQAMNERKRLVDVATSIVNVYRLLQEQKQKGAR
ncbi:MAG: histidine kinase [Paenibacillus sp.]|jgi:response regulator NasT|nr:histidine kinase [Paenibacillus sp.]